MDVPLNMGVLSLAYASGLIDQRVTHALSDIFIDVFCHTQSRQNLGFASCGCLRTKARAWKMITFPFKISLNTECILQKTNMSLENQWLEDLSYWNSLFFRDMLVFGVYYSICQASKVCIHTCLWAYVRCADMFELRQKFWGISFEDLWNSTCNNLHLILCYIRIS